MLSRLVELVTVLKRLFFVELIGSALISMLHELHWGDLLPLREARSSLAGSFGLTATGAFSNSISVHLKDLGV